MNKNAILIWIPRVAGVLFILFISLFALDVFSESYESGKTLIALFVHLIPTLILSIALILAWKQKLPGALLFIAFGIWYLFEMWGKFPWVVYMVMAGTPILVGGLFLGRWKINKRSYLMFNGTMFACYCLNRIGVIAHAAMNVKFSMASSMSCEPVVSGKIYPTTFKRRRKRATVACWNINDDTSGRKF
jgi:hypothetical protein